MATAKLDFINLPLPRPTGADPTSAEGKIERAFLDWAKQIVLALQKGSVVIPDTAAASEAVTTPNTTAAALAALAASAVNGPTATSTPTGAAGGDLSGNYPNPRIAKINGVTPGDVVGHNLAEIYGNVSSMLNSVLPSGVILQWPAALASIPTGWLLCDGSVLNVADYELLGALLGAKYGGDGMTTFGVPSTAALFMLGTTTDVDVGTNGGTNQHKHAVGTLVNANESAHTHGAGSYQAAGQAFTGSSVAAATTNATPHLVAPDTTGTGVSPVTTAAGSNAASAVSGTSGAGSAHTHTISGKTDVAQDAGGGTADEDVLPPWLKLAFIIKT